MITQDLRQFLDDYLSTFPDDMIEVARPVTGPEVAAIVWELASRDRHELLRFTNVSFPDRPSTTSNGMVTNMFASRARVERMLGAAPGHLHEQYDQLASDLRPMACLDNGPVTANEITGADVDLAALPLIEHFETDLGPYITSGIIVAEDPSTGCGNLSYHRAVVSDRTRLATSLHSRGDLWRMLKVSESRGESLPVAMAIGGHPLFMLSASARVPADVDEREVAGGLFGAPLDVIRTPRYGIKVPASAEYVLEGQIDPNLVLDEGPFGEFSGYSSSRSTHNCLEVQTILHRDAPLWVDVVGGNSNEHLNLARIPRESELSAKLKARFPAVVRLGYPNAGTHFVAYVAVNQQRSGEARQVMLALLGWDPYLKIVVAVDSDVDTSSDASIVWALANHFQPARDVFTVDGLPGSPLDPSSRLDGSTSRMGLDATRASDFDGTRITIADSARERALEILTQLDSRRDVRFPISARPRPTQPGRPHS